MNKLRNKWYLTCFFKINVKTNVYKDCVKHNKILKIHLRIEIVVKDDPLVLFRKSVENVFNL